MPLGCGLSVCKWILGFFNFLIFVCGGAILGVGIWLLVDAKRLVKVLTANDEVLNDPDIKSISIGFLQTVAIILIVLGAIVFLLGFLGCCGACMESQCMLITYAVLLTLLLIAEVGSVIYAAVAKDSFEKTLKKGFKASLKYYESDENDAVNVLWDEIFKDYKCCGVDNYKDLEQSRWFTVAQTKSPPEKIPKSCCKPGEDDSCKATIDYDRTNAERGCYKKFTAFINTHQAILIGVCVGVALVQLICIVIAFIVGCAVNKTP